MIKPAKPQIRVYITEEKDRLLKAIAGIKDSSVNAIASFTLDHWLDESEQKEAEIRHSAILQYVKNHVE